MSAQGFNSPLIQLDSDSELCNCEGELQLALELGDISAMSLRRDAIWTAMDTFATAGLAFLFRLLVARVLSPHDFGLVAIVLAVVAVLQVVNDFGLTAALIQKDEAKVTPALVNTTFTASLIVSIALCAGTILLVAPIASAFYDEPMVGPLLAVLSISLLPSPFTTVTSALLFRKHLFREVAINRCITTTLSLAVACALLWWRPSPWVVVWQSIASGVLSTIGLCYVARWRFRLTLHTVHLKDIFGFSSFVLGGDLIGSFQANAGVFILGRMLSTSDVGLYSIGIYMTDTVRKVLASILNRVTFVHYSQNKHDPAALRQSYVSTVIWNCRLIMPVMVAMLLFGPSLFGRFLGPEWSQLGPVIRWLSLAIIVQAAGGAVSTLYKGMGRPGLDMTLMVINTGLILLPALLLGAWWNGLTGAAIATAAARTIAVLIRQVTLNNLIGSTIGPVFRSFCKYMALQAPLFVAWSIGALMLPGHGPILDIILAALGLATYGLYELPRAFPMIAAKLPIFVRRRAAR
ncbi:oligosaccharide flippase family protein [Sphingomonas montanisoli]|nr:oligosaccharide flippase family protein [Sphingomonas montanisoli]